MNPPLNGRPTYQLSPARVAIFLLGLTAGCATVPMATAAEDARIKALAAPSDGGLIYLYRNESFGGAVHMDVVMDGWPAGQTGPNTFMVWQVGPGRHTIVSKAEEDSTISVDVAAGGRYFVWQEVKMGFLYARSKLQVVPEPQGQRGVKECGLIKMAQPRTQPRRAPAPPAVAPTPPQGAPAPGTT